MFSNDENGGLERPPPETVMICVALLGDNGVGKSSLMHSLKLWNEFQKAKTKTGRSFEDWKAEFNANSYCNRGNAEQDIPRVAVELLDESNQDEELKIFAEFIDVPSNNIAEENWLEGAAVVLLCFSEADPKSFENLEKKWLPLCRRECPQARAVLVGCKSDLRGRTSAEPAAAAAGAAAPPLRACAWEDFRFEGIGGFDLGPDDCTVENLIASTLDDAWVEQLPTQEDLKNLELSTIDKALAKLCTDLSNTTAKGSRLIKKGMDSNTDISKLGRKSNTRIQTKQQEECQNDIENLSFLSLINSNINKTIAAGDHQQEEEEEQKTHSQSEEATKLRKEVQAILDITGMVLDPELIF